MEETPKLIGVDYSVTSQDVIEVLIEDVPEPGLFDEIARANTHRPEILRLLLAYAETPEEVRKFIKQQLNLPFVEEAVVAVAGKTQEMRRETLTSKIQKLSVTARIQLALKGGREIRGILAKDPNKEVQLSLLENGRISEAEIETIVRSRSTLEEALRRISRNREWMKNYNIVLAFVNNPKTPAGIAMTYVTDLKIKDLAMLEKNKNVSEAVRGTAKRLLGVRKPH